MNKFLKLAFVFLSATSLTNVAIAGRGDDDDNSSTTVTDNSTDSSTTTAARTAAAPVTPAKNNSSGFSTGAMVGVGAFALGGGIAAGIALERKGTVKKVTEKVKNNETVKAVVNKFSKNKAAEVPHTVNNAAHGNVHAEIRPQRTHSEGHVHEHAV